MTQPPGTGSLPEQFNDLRRQIAEVARRSPAFPACRIRLGTDASLATGTTVAQTLWAVAEDPFNMWTAPGAAPCFITIQLDGYYHIHYHSTVLGTPGQVMAGQVHLNGTATGSSVATDIRELTALGGNGAVSDAIRARMHLASGDKLYWSNYSSAAGTLVANNVGVPTEVTVQYIASR